MVQDRKNSAPLIPRSWKPYIRSHTLNRVMELLLSIPDDQCLPPKDQVFRALELVDPDKVRVLILGQDPYHGEGQANGLAFSVNPDVKIPPSLRNIFTELKNDLGIYLPNGDLTHWAQQGILLLNTTLTVAPDAPGSHFEMGWEEFTDEIVQAVLAQEQPKVLLLWGSKAKQKLEIFRENVVHTSKNLLILSSSHPSPYSADNGFFGSRPFSAINKWFASKFRRGIRW